ncbi:Metallo-dependent phosphatase-like protein [Desarmillaria tabescens]|uniref:Metallo-dependent phosphatase-like protein n=1 Tax=Armillaria tabescens TaxID=1929756 RepID=A0AA39N546_ARMTA|nr:Metallo-dependent phosphatase-like protein [Desarmillaria tabescens]KAK0457759.1 Metallo-dependent phosphatase-like protein [Desarmillaria tabescens]
MLGAFTATSIMLVRLLVVVAAISLTWACADGDGHVHEHPRRANPSSPLTPPTRPLEWGDINIIHTTDSHGWLLGHQKASFPEPNYSGDLGDFASFVAHMKEIAVRKDVDLLLVDSGDLHDGTGLSDGYPPGGVDGHESTKFLAELPYDVMAIGNHELYVYANTLDMHQNLAPKLNGRYLSSNVNITLADQNNNTVDVPVGSRFAKFKTRKGRSVTALGVIFDFTGNDQNTTVQKVEDMVKESWFLEAIKDEPDFFLLAGHMPVSRDNWPLVFNAVRAVHATTPILILGGHTHIRDCIQLDGRSMSLESGRYMETVGWMSLKLDGQRGSKNLTFSRRYLDPNRVTYEYHTRQSQSSFDTEKGQAITAGLNQLAVDFDLNFTYGTAPHDFTITQVQYPSNDSQLSLFAELATPYALSISNSRADIPNYILVNSGSQRFDIYAGTFTKNDQLTASPFSDIFFYIPEVPLSVALDTLKTMNENGSENRKRSLEREEQLYRRGDVRARYMDWLSDMEQRAIELGIRAANNLTLGYVTTDSCPGVGDDIIHTPLPFYFIPDFIGSTPPDVSNDTLIDFVFVDFVVDQVVETLNIVQSNKEFTSGDVGKYSTLETSEVLGIYAQFAWN